jgi:peptide/nickel transport system substrate-binding protein
VAPFDDVNVRIALKYAINRKQLVDILLSGYGQVGNDVPITPANWFFNTEMPQHAYDPDKARHYLKKAGIAIKVIREPNDGYWSNVWLKNPFCTCFWSGRPTEDLMFTTAYAADSPWNDTHWKNKRFNELLVQARTELDSDRRREMYWEIM